MSGRAERVGALSRWIALGAPLFLLAACPRAPDPAPGAGEGDPGAALVVPEREPDPPIDPTAPVDRAALRTPLARAALGDWAIYETPDGPLRVEVTATSPSSITIRRGAATEEISLALEERAYVRTKDPGRLGADRYETEGGALEIGDREVACLIVRPRGADGVVVPGEEVWYTDEVFLEDGVVLRRSEGRETLRLVDWGGAPASSEARGERAGGPEEPR